MHAWTATGKEGSGRREFISCCQSESNFTILCDISMQNGRTINNTNNVNNNNNNNNNIGSISSGGGGNEYCGIAIDAGALFVVEAGSFCSTRLESGFINFQSNQSNVVVVDSRNFGSFMGNITVLYCCCRCSTQKLACVCSSASNGSYQGLS
jgi:hypothetical protein